MKLKNIIMSAALLAGCLTASAQESQPAAKAANAFAPHWYLQAQAGGQYTLGEVDFSDLLSGNVQVGAGYNFTPVWGLRLSLNAWQSKGGSDLDYLGLGERTWKYKYIAPSLDVTCDLTNWILGYKAGRVCNFGLLAGIGLNFAWHNCEAQSLYGLVAATEVATGITAPLEHQMTYLWDGTTTRVVGRFGAYLDFNVSRRVALGLELNNNFLSDTYNSKDAGNVDWYFNLLAGVKVRLGKLGKKATATPVEPVVVEKIVEKIVEKPVEKVVEKVVYKDQPAPEKRETLRRDIFYTLRGSDISRTEMAKIEDVVNYLNKYPEANVTITGYADKNTGNPTLNVGYARSRAQGVADILNNKYGIERSRMTVDSKGDTVQPYEQNDLNRVTICIAE
ncbi:MAG: OmpA family protein [Bacteroidaceae bacterium]|nr:OmpA family protein [Bacteroidaceae bacterium]MBQ9294589.1 OmpA family protein [Bacteroidaceae bacterium]